jgi:hypothetical protein
MTSTEERTRTSPRPDVSVASLDATAYTIPTERPEGDGTLTWDATTLVLVRATSSDPGLPTGLGWTYAAAAAARVVDDLLAPAVSGHDALDIGASW